MQDDKPSRWQKLQKLSFNRKDLTKRMRRAEGVTVRHARKFIFRRIGSVREVRRHIIMWVVAIGLLIGASGVQLMWYQNNYKTDAASNDGTYAEAVQGPIETLNPLFATSSAEESASRLLFSRLLTYDTSGTLGNDIATNVVIGDKGTSYTVSLRPDVRWHDGRQLSANDVAFTVGLLKNPAVRSTITGWNDIKVTVVDDTTIVFKLPTIYAAFSHALTFPILPKHILSDVEPNAFRENAFSQNPVGSGPFQLRLIQDIDLVAGRKVIHLEQNQDYYKGAPKIELFQLHTYATQDAIVQALSTGEVNAAADVAGDTLSGVDADRYTITTHDINNGVYALFNTAGILKDKQLRKALQLGTDTQLARDQLAVEARPLDLPLLDSQLSGDAIPKKPSLNVAEAKRILDKAGWKQSGDARVKGDRELKLTIVTTKDSDYERILEVLAGQWRDLGFIIETQIYDPSDVAQAFVQDVLQQRKYDVLLYQLTIGADPDVFAYWHSTQATSRGFNFSNYATNPVSDDALLSARFRLEPDLRNTKYIAFVKQWVNDAPAIGLYQSTTNYVHSKSVQPLADNNTLISPIDRYADVLYWSAGNRTVYTTP